MAEHLHRHAFVNAHAGELFLGELARLVQQLVGHDELADVVHQRREAQPLHAGRHEVELLTDVTGVHRDPLRVTGGVRILLLERADEQLHRLVVRFLHAHVRREHLTRDEDRHDDEQHHRGTEAEVEPTEKIAEQHERQRLGRSRPQIAEDFARNAPELDRVRRAAASTRRPRRRRPRPATPH